MAKPRTDDETRQASDAGRCAWRSQHRCLHRGVYAPTVVGGTQTYCSWHAECLRNSTSVDNRERFDRFLDFLRRGLYCVVWTHYEPDVLWGTIYGEETSAKPTPCQNPSCSVRLDRERELGYVLPHPPRLPTAPLTHLLGQRIDSRLQAGERTAEDKARLEAERVRQLQALREQVR